MYRKHLFLLQIIVWISMILPSLAWCGNWGGDLVGGGHIEVDPTTNKATLYNPEGATVPMWDGVHRLDDGNTVIIRDGVMVPNEDILELRDDWVRDRRVAVEEGLAPCDVLVRKVCGFGDECSGSSMCGQARQLLEFAAEEQRERSLPGFAARFLELPGQCREALSNEAYFKPCNKEMSVGEPTQCARLVGRVCGEGNRCGEADICASARELLEREYEERLAAEDPQAPTPVSEICAQALAEGSYFSACRD